MMDSSLYLLIFLILCCCNLNILTNSYSSMQSLCHEGERSALLQFNHSFFIKKFASGDPSAYAKVEAWKLNVNSSDCCSWDGVECDHDTGHVIGLALNSSFLYGFINSNSSLFSLVHLRRLNLANNHFNYSRIPTRIGNLSRLMSLELHNSFFSGQISSEISSLSELTFLDLSSYIDDISRGHLLKLEKPSLGNLVQNLTNLKVLELSGVINMSSTVPRALSNITSLIFLDLFSCLLYGEFPMDIFHLPNLWILGISFNENLFGVLPKFSRSSPLGELMIAETSFSGLLPTSIGNLDSLTMLDLGDSDFEGMLPPSVGNLTQLTYLNVIGNNFGGQIPSSIENLSELTSILLGSGTLDAGTLPFLFGKLSKLISLYFIGTNLSVALPPSLANLTVVGIFRAEESFFEYFFPVV